MEYATPGPTTGRHRRNQHGSGETCYGGQVPRKYPLSVLKIGHPVLKNDCWGMKTGVQATFLDTGRRISPLRIRVQDRRILVQRAVFSVHGCVLWSRAVRVSGCRGMESRDVRGHQRRCGAGRFQGQKRRLQARWAKLAGTAVWMPERAAEINGVATVGSFSFPLNIGDACRPGSRGLLPVTVGPEARMPGYEHRRRCPRIGSWPPRGQVDPGWEPAWTKKTPRPRPMRSVLLANPARSVLQFLVALGSRQSRQLLGALQRLLPFASRVVQFLRSNGVLNTAAPPSIQARTPY